MSEIQSHSIQEFQTGGSTSLLFNNLSNPTHRLSEISNAIDSFERDYTQTLDKLSSDQNTEMLKAIKGLQDRLKQEEKLVRTQIMKGFLEWVEDVIAGLSDPESPQIGHDFIEAMHNTNCKTVIDEELGDCAATYVSYSYVPENKGFINEIQLNPDRTDDIMKFASSLDHEETHSFQKKGAQALHLSPFNPDTRVIVHPIDWILSENVCERDAFTKQAWLNSLLAAKNPQVRDNTKLDPVSVADFEKIRKASPSLQQTLTHVAINALFKKRNDESTFEDYYHAKALQNYSAGMWNRIDCKESGFTFVRLEDQDLWQIGNYGVGPNSLGENELAPQLRGYPNLNEKNMKKLKELCEKYDIPDRKSCMTMRECNALQEQAIIPARQPQPAFA